MGEKFVGDREAAVREVRDFIGLMRWVKRLHDNQPLPSDLCVEGGAITVDSQNGVAYYSQFAMLETIFRLDQAHPLRAKGQVAEDQYVWRFEADPLVDSLRSAFVEVITSRGPKREQIICAVSWGWEEYEDEGFSYNFDPMISIHI